MRVTVNAHLSVGLVNIPVGVSPFTNRQGETALKTLHVGCEAPIRQEMTCTVCGAEHLGPTDLVKGFEVSKDQFVTFSDSELQSLKPKRSPVIELKAFVSTALNVDALTVASHWLVPSEAFQVPYSVLWCAMESIQVFGVGSCCLWGKEHLCAVVWDEEGLRLALLLNPSTIVVPDFQLREAPDEAVEMASTLLSQMTRKLVSLSEFAPVNESMGEAVAAKLAGFTPKALPEAPVETTVDLMQSLKASIAAAGSKPKRARRAA